VPAKVVPVVAGNSCEIGIQLVVGLREERPIGTSENAHHVGEHSVQSPFVFCVKNDSEGELSQLLPIPKHTEAVSKIFDVSLFRFIDEYVARIDCCGVGPYR